MQSVRIRSFCDPYFPAFGLNTDQKNSEQGFFSRSVRLRWLKNCETFGAAITFLSKCFYIENEEWSVSFSKDIALQLGTLPSITFLRTCFLRFAIRLAVPNRETPDTLDFWLKNKMFYNNFNVFVIIPALVYLLH